MRRTKVKHCEKTVLSRTNSVLGGKSGLKGVPRGRNELYVIPRAPPGFPGPGTQRGPGNPGGTSICLPSSHSWFLGFRRLTRDSRIPAHFFVKKFRKILKINLSDSRDQNKITKFLWLFYMTSISYINPLFRAPSPPKPLKSNPGGQNLPGDPLIAQSDHQGPVSAQSRPLVFHFSTSVSSISLS